VNIRQFERYWPPGCKYANSPFYWAYRDLNPWHGWACPVSKSALPCECPGRTFMVRRCQEELDKKKSLEVVTHGEARADI